VGDVFVRLVCSCSCPAAALSPQTPTADSGMDLRAAPDPTKQYYSSSLFCSVLFCYPVPLSSSSSSSSSSSYLSLLNSAYYHNNFTYHFPLPVHCCPYFNTARAFTVRVPPSSGHLQLRPRALAYLPKPRCHSTTFSPTQNTFLSLSFLPHNHLTITSHSPQSPPKHRSTLFTPVNRSPFNL
jgi:hypothetical protein